MKNHCFIGTKRTSLLWLTVLTMAAVSLASSDCRQVKASAEPEKQVREFVEAFNARNIDAMLELADENIQWLTVEGSKISIEVEGKAALRQSMERYFKSCPSCKSSLEQVQKAGTRMTAMERASWESKSGPKSQRSLSVYEFSGDKILRVYYFPAEADTPQRSNERWLVPFP